MYDTKINKINNKYISNVFLNFNDESLIITEFL